MHCPRGMRIQLSAVLLLCLAACVQGPLDESAAGAANEDPDKLVVPSRGPDDTYVLSNDIEARTAVCAALITNGWLRDQPGAAESLLSSCSTITLVPDRRTYSRRDYQQNSNVAHTRNWDLHLELGGRGFDVELSWGTTSHAEGWYARVDREYSAEAASSSRSLLEPIVGEALPRVGYEIRYGRAMEWNPQYYYSSDVVENDARALRPQLVAAGTIAADATASTHEIAYQGTKIGTLVAFGYGGQGRLAYYDAAGHFLTDREWPTLFQLPE